MAVELKGLTKRSENYSQWYNELVVKADLAEQSAVRGCMVIKPYGYAIWEKMQRRLDDMFKATGHVNAYFPLLIPKSYFTREAEHVAGFAKECAVVTHYRLKKDDNSSEIIVDPDAKLEEEYIIRPTSETIIWSTYKNWIKSYRDLPILINQWANVMRWEMRTRPFLRTSEFLWQEGHTAHATAEEAEAEAEKMLHVYGEFAENYMAVPVIRGVKTANERFAGALNTYTIEGLMQDGKALQCGTSHFLGQNFAKSFDVQFLDQNNKLDYVWATSWGVSTRLVGALIMTHSDDNGLVLPPNLAPIQVVIVPIYKNDEMLKQIDAKVESIVNTLRGMGISVKYDNADNRRPGFKFADYELKGVPVRLVLGGRDLENGTIEVMRRDTLEKETMPIEGIEVKVKDLLDDMQKNIFKKAVDLRNSMIYKVNSYDEFKTQIEKGGFILAHWDGTTETELRIKEETKATIRCIPFEADEESLTPGIDMLTGKPSVRRVLFARAY
jgi:prolyl-tRNA synthetase